VQRAEVCGRKSKALVADKRHKRRRCRNKGTARVIRATGSGSQSFVASSKLSGSVPGFGSLQTWDFWALLALPAWLARGLFVIQPVAPRGDWSLGPSHHAIRAQMDAKIGWLAGLNSARWPHSLPIDAGATGPPLASLPGDFSEQRNHARDASPARQGRMADGPIFVRGLCEARCTTELLMAAHWPRGSSPSNHTHLQAYLTEEL
jgi:hypothetical protein